MLLFWLTYMHSVSSPGTQAKISCPKYVTFVDKEVKQDSGKPLIDEHFEQ